MKQVNVPESDGLYARIYRAIREVPRGRVASYGQIAEMVGGCSARMVGYALAALPEGLDVPWHRIVNRRGEIRLQFGADEQRERLEGEGVRFDPNGRIDMNTYGW